MAHPLSGRRGDTGNKRRHGFAHVLTDPLSTLFFVRASDLATHNNSIRLRVIIEKLHHVLMFEAVYGITANPHTGRLTHSKLGKLIHDLVGQCARTRYHANPSGGMYIAGHDSDLNLPRRNHPRTVGTDKGRA